MTRSEELRAMVADATAGPWEVSLPPTVPGHIYSERQGQRGAIVAHLALDDRRKANARLIAQAPTLATDLAAALKREAALREALEKIAKQKRTDELETEADVECADFEGGYDACIDIARAALGAKP